jgi:pimeloyl-ACP methyl ester carboxylesterase
MLILLIGWFESTPKQLMPFMELHRGPEDQTHILIGSGIDSLFCLDRLYASCEAKVPSIANAAGDGDILVHAFSDAGFTVLCILLQILRRTDEGRRILGHIRGIILESAPAIYSADRAEFSRRFAHVMTRFLLRRLRWPAERYQAILMPVFERCLDLYQVGWARTVRRIQGAFDAVSEDYPACPHLFLYGVRDAITPPAAVEAFASALQARGVPRHAVRFDTEVHLGCYRAAPEAYREAISDFRRTLR